MSSETPGFGGGLNTIIGALIAAMILFLSNIITLFAENPDLTFGDISQAAWVSIGGGVLLSFLKDFQALWVRSKINRITGSGDGGGAIK